ncbi:IcmT/TraK family protein [Klebsiella aerogenes]|uniref:IcmT/TraK family protein n=1 Tax=Klebsiella aerogenes TaxID=548 RepID=UPI0006696762|nr:IcmT/TraK family protein [Klebsiella aerogenes]
MNISPWRDASRRLEIFGIPALLLPLYFAWFHWPCLITIYLCTLLIGIFKVISLFGYTLTVLWFRIMHWLRGNHITGRPWWYRRFFE